MSQLSNKDLDRLSSELSSFARSDIPMPQGLAQLHDSLPSGNLKALTSHLAQTTDQGQPLSDALTSATVSVPVSYIALVRCGELSGDMSGVLDFALRHGRMMQRHRSSLGTILIYPMLVISVMLGVMGLVAIFIVPRFRDIYDMLGAELPGPTQLIISFSDIIATYGHVLLLALISAGAYLVYVIYWDRRSTWMLNRLPGVRNLIYLSDTAVMSEFIGHFISRGVPLPDACRAASLVVYDDGMRRSLEAMAAEAERGGHSGEALNPRVPATAAWLYRQGEARGTLSETCAGIARYCENRFELLSRRTLYMMEPIFILMIALVVGFVVIAFYLPLFNIPRIVGR